MVRYLRYSLIAFAALLLIATASIAVPYWKISKTVDKQLDRGPFAGTYSFYAAPEVIATGDPLGAEQLLSSLFVRRPADSSTGKERARPVRRAPA